MFSPDMRIHEFKISDKQAKDDFEKLIGIKINAPYVRLTHEFYLEHMNAIHGIQFGAAMRKRLS